MRSSDAVLGERTSAHQAGRMRSGLSSGSSGCRSARQPARSGTARRSPGKRTSNSCRIHQPCPANRWSKRWSAFSQWASVWSCAAPGRDIVVRTPGIRICPVIPCGSRSISRYSSSNVGTALGGGGHGQHGSTGVLLSRRSASDGARDFAGNQRGKGCPGRRGGCPWTVGGSPLADARGTDWRLRRRLGSRRGSRSVATRPIVKPIRRIVNPIRPIVKAIRRIVKAIRRIVKAIRRVVKPIRRIVKPIRRIVNLNRRIVKPNRRIVKPNRRIVKPNRRIVNSNRRIVEAIRPVGFTIRRLVETIGRLATTIRRIGITIGRIAAPSVTIRRR